MLTMPPVEGSTHLFQSVDTIVVADVFQSVLIMKEHELDFIRRWQDFVTAVVGKILPATGGQMVKSLGDGLMLRFADARPAVRTAHEIQGYWAEENLKHPKGPKVLLRVGVNISNTVRDEHDIYGQGVNLAARICTLAGPGEIVVSSEVRDQLTAHLDGEIEDLGDCFLKHVDEALRLYRVGPAGPSAVAASRREYATPLQPTIAVIPFSSRVRTPEQMAIGEMIADGVIAQLSRSGSVRVISRLSTSAFRDRGADVADVEKHLGATYVLSGSYLVHEPQILVTVELVDTRDNRIIWAERLDARMSDLFLAESALVQAIIEATQRHVIDLEVRRTFTQPLPTLDSYSLLIGSINHMHRSNAKNFDRSKELLDLLIERHRRVAAPRSWLAQWYVLRTTRGISSDRARDGRSALDATRQALEADPSDPLAMATQGFVYCHLFKDLATAQQLCDEALVANPNEALAWLYSGVIHAFQGNGALATQASERALALSPIDPQRYYFESLAATAAVSARDYPKAQALAQSSLRLNRMHPSTWRMLTVALVEQDKMDEARAATEQLRALEPKLTVASYLKRAPNGELAVGREWAKALQAAGLPPGDRSEP